MKSVSFFSSLAIFLGAALVSAGVSAQPPQKPELKSYSYRTRIPVVAGVDCAQNAANLAQRWAQTTAPKAVDVVGQCQLRQTVNSRSGAYTVDAVVVNYRAESELALYRASISGGAMNEAGWNVEPYHSYSDCLKDLPQQRAIFERETSLPLIAASCEPPSDDLNDGFSLEMVSYGTPQLRFFAAQSLLFNNNNLAPFTDRMATIIANLGGVITFQDQSRIFYYAKEAIKVSVFDFGSFSAKICEEQKPLAQQILVASGRSDATLVCEADLYKTIHLNAIAAGYLKIAIGFTAAPVKYLSYDECMVDRERALTQLKTYRTDVMGGLCTSDYMNANGYVLQVFVQR